MTNKKVVHTDDVTLVSPWNSPEFETDDRSSGDQPKILKTLDDAQIEALKKQAKFGKHIVHTNDVSRVGIWDEPEFVGGGSAEIIHPSNESTQVFSKEELAAREQKIITASRLTSSEDHTSIAIWDMPIFDSEGKSGVIEVPEKTVKMPTVEELEAVQNDARDEAYKEGLAQGQADGFEQGKQEGYQVGLTEGQTQGREQAFNEAQAEINAQIEQLKALCNSLSDPLSTLDNDVEQELVSVAMAVARQVVRREIKSDPGQVIAAVRQAVSILPINTRNIRVYLHPEDAALVKESLSVPENGEEEQRWKIVEDPALSRGGCNVESDLSRIDATIETRISAAIAQALGGERNSDND